MGFVEAIQSVIAKYTKFSGRARRSEFWYWVLGVFIVAVVVGIIERIIGLTTPYLSIVFELAILLPSLAVSVRRLKDTGHDWYWILVGFIPLVGLVVLYFCILDSDKGGNKFGPSPKE